MACLEQPKGLAGHCTNGNCDFTLCIPCMVSPKAGGALKGLFPLALKQELGCDVNDLIAGSKLGWNFYALNNGFQVTLDGLPLGCISLVGSFAAVSTLPRCSYPLALHFHGYLAGVGRNSLEKIASIGGTGHAKHCNCTQCSANAGMKKKKARKARK